MGRIQKIQKEGAEETDDVVLHHSGSICDQTLGLTLRTFQKHRKKGGPVAGLAFELTTASPNERILIIVQETRLATQDWPRDLQ